MTFNQRNHNYQIGQILSSSCEHKYWWKRRKVIATQGQSELLETQDKFISIPLPSFPPALDFNPDHFISSYNKISDPEKQQYPIKAPNIDLEDDTSTLCSLETSKQHRTLQDCEDALRVSRLPAKRHYRYVRHLRLTIFTVYRRLFSVIFLLNFCGVLALLHRHAPGHAINLNTLATFASTNFLVAILIRQDFVVNMLFRTAWLVPWSIPLSIRRLVARVYCYGGIHSGAAVAGTMWWTIFTTLLSVRFAQSKQYTIPITVLTWLILVLLCTTVLLAYPSIRSNHHNTFEFTHRFLGWSSVTLFWVQFFLLTYHVSKETTFGNNVPSFLHAPTFWNLTIITVLLIYPWTRLRLWTFTATPLSTHTLRLSFTNPVHKFSCLSISSSPLREWHPFATFPSRDPNTPHGQIESKSAGGGSMVISSAGDWTRSIIHDTLQTSQTQSQIQTQSNPHPITLTFWVKSTPKAGVLSLTTLFPRVILLTTGSGIGPALSSLLDAPPSQSIRLIWSTRSPLITYGQSLCELVHRADPNAVVIDTSVDGRGDLVDLAWRMYCEVRAEAVFVLSNAGVTRRVVYGLESRGVLAFGPIWDS